MRLENKVALVTGAARGIGKAIVLAFAQEGADLALADIEEATLDQTKQEIASLGRRVFAQRCDVSDPSQVERLVTDAERALGPIDILVNNAGIGGGGGVWETDHQTWQRILGVNLMGAYYFSHRVLPRMIERKRGRIINIASIGGKIPFYHSAAYVTSKHGLIGMTRSIALDTATLGITCNAICPSWTLTEMALSYARSLMASQNITLEEALAHMPTNPQNRIMDAAEVAQLAVMLASDAAAGITGQAINVDGGAVMY